MQNRRIKCFNKAFQIHDFQLLQQSPQAKKKANCHAPIGPGIKIAFCGTQMSVNRTVLGQTQSANNNTHLFGKRQSLVVNFSTLRFNNDLFLRIQMLKGEINKPRCIIYAFHKYILLHTDNISIIFILTKWPSTI